MKPPLRIANASAFYGDRFSAVREMLEGGPIDVLTGDYLAELTMLILWKQRQRDASLGYAKTFLAQMEQCLGLARQRGVKIVTNAGGLAPAALARALRHVAERLGLAVNVAHVEGDDVLADLPRFLADGHTLAHLDSGRLLAESALVPITANAYLGGMGIATALAAGADVVVTGRVTDAALVVGPAVAHFGWARDDWDRLAAAVVVGHVLECGPQATGGNHPFLEQLPDARLPGFPLAELHDDGSAIITKHEGTGGAVTIDTVTGQLLYEIDSPRYANPDVVALFDTIELEDAGKDRVRIVGTRGEPPPETLKVCINAVGGFRNSMSFGIPGLDVSTKAARLRTMLFARLGGEQAFDEVDVRLVRGREGDDATSEEATSWLHVTVKDRDATKVGRAFSDTALELALASHAGCHLGSPPQAAEPFGVYWPTLVPRAAVHERVVLHDGAVVLP